MKRSKNLFALVLCVSLLFTGCGSNSSSELSAAGDSQSASYAEKLFTTDTVHTIDVELSAEDWADLKENPTDKTKYKAAVTIDGETISDVSFATKGNTSLTAVAKDEDSDRYSFKINFGKYTDGQTYYGLDKLNLNNLYADATYMKDYLSYRIFEEAGLDSPLTSYIWVTVNGEDVGLYLAIEDVSESYLTRTTEGEGELYKPETEQLANMANANNGMQMPDHTGSSDQTQPPAADGETGTVAQSGDTGQMTPPTNGEMPEMPNGDSKSENMPEGVGGHNMGQVGPNGNLGGGDNGASLKYTDDEIESYSDIFDNAETDADDSDMQQVIAALKNLSEGNVEDSLDTDSVIAYFAAHNFVMNYDSYTGNMLHNYYLYENDGKLSMIPWDYNLAFGAFTGQNNSGTELNNATAIVNCGIDSPLSGAEEDDRPMWSWITSDEEYLEKYHDVMDHLITGYFESGEFETEVNAIYKMILPYVEKDTSGFYDAEEFQTAFETLKTFCTKRAESIRLQLDGTLSTVTSEQTQNSKVDASDITISDMGSQGGTAGTGPERQGTTQQNN